MIPDRFGKYRVLRRIASGGMAEVYLCRLSGEAGFRKRVALKVVHPRLAGDPRFRALFASEARLAASLSHPNLVQVFDFGREEDALYLAMEYIEGWNLAQAAEQSRQLHVPIPPGVWRHWVDGIGSCLAYLHENGIVHRDVSPSNVLVSRNGAVKVTDFGISRAAGIGSPEGGTPAGKSGYLAPERIRGEEATFVSDLFAAGVISTELILGRRMFEGDGPEEIRERILRFDARTLALPGVPTKLAEALRKTVASNPADRYSGVGRFLVELASVGPSPASAPVMADFWDGLFPVSREEETAPDTAAEPESRPAFVREAEGRYGRRGKTLQAGTAAVFAAALVGGVLLWKEVRRNPAIDPAPAAPAPAVPTAPRAAPAAAPSASIAVATRDPVSRPAPPPGPAPRSLDAPGRQAAPVAPIPPVARLVRIETDPAGASVLLESGVVVGKTPLQMDTASLAGRKIVLSREGYDPRSVPVDALAAGPVFRVELQPVIGTLEAIQAIPWAKVYLGNRLLGETPLTGVRLPVGELRLRFVNEPLGVDQVRTVVVLPGSNPKVIVPMTGAAPR